MNINFTERFISAIELAAVAHQNQIRKGNQKPYIVHPYTVGMLLLEANCSEDTIIAGILHDVVEDTYVGYEEIDVFCKQKIQRIAAKYTETCKLSFNLIFVVQLDRRKRIF
ncbi:HD domain-containing protein [Priestia megaterium]|uniref:HD domain-containing protein n=1 Tax=Priestia megaterium TaxID=1404 RepID=UPI002D80BC44|nr:HD domain-containing protein [Priestia megaterium]MEB4860669.1 HD domain-containing protein [Priestia megaterium]